MEIPPAIRTQEDVKRVLHYNPKTGVFTRKIKTNRNQQIGEVVGNIDKWGYVRISYQNKRYKAHRLAWLYVKGEWPEKDVDHEDQDRSNNRIDNLRSVSRRINLRNAKLFNTNTSGRVGVSFNKRDKRWYVSISQIPVGSSKSFDDAVAIREKYETKMKYHVNHGKVR